MPPLGTFDLQGKLVYGDGKNLLKRPYLLPSLTNLNSESTFADVGVCWNEKALHLAIDCKSPFKSASFLDIENSDAIELFIDTRDVKTTAFITRFCHHFVFLPTPEDGIQIKEVTRFRGEEKHPLCDPDVPVIKSEFGKRGYTIHLELPSEALFSYQPEQVPKLGLSYRIRRAEGAPQHFSLPSNFYSLHQHPALWPSFMLVKTP